MESPDAFTRIEDAIAKIVEAGKRPVSLGGDHSITAPILRAVGRRIPPITLVHFYAHPDLYPDYEGNPHSPASPFARIMQEQLAHPLIPIRLRTLNNHQYEQSQAH